MGTTTVINLIEYGNVFALCYGAHCQTCLLISATQTHTDPLTVKAGVRLPPSLVPWDLSVKLCSPGNVVLGPHSQPCGRGRSSLYPSPLPTPCLLLFTSMTSPSCQTCFGDSILLWGVARDFLVRLVTK